MNQVIKYNKEYSKEHHTRIPASPDKMRILFVCSIVVSFVSFSGMIFLLQHFRGNGIFRYLGYFEKILQMPFIIAIIVVPTVYICIKESAFMHTQSAIVEYEDKLYLVELSKSTGKAFVGMGTPSTAQMSIDAAVSNLQAEKEMQEIKQIPENYLEAVRNFLIGERDGNLVFPLDGCIILQENERKMKIAYQNEDGHLYMHEIRNAFPNAFDLIHKHSTKDTLKNKVRNQYYDILHNKIVIVFILILAAIAFLPWIKVIPSVCQNERNYLQYVQDKSYEEYISKEEMKEVIKEVIKDSSANLVIDSSKVWISDEELIIDLYGKCDQTEFEMHYRNEIVDGTIDKDGWKCVYRIY